MNAPKTSTRRIEKLRIALLKDRRFAIPKLQRNFVWDANRAAKLLDSMYYQMPVGSIFLWQMDIKSAHLIRQAEGVLPPFGSQNKHIWFVIDGQQRLSVIYQAFRAEKKRNDAGREIDFGRLCFVVNPGFEDDNPDRIVYRKPVDGEFIPVHDILATDWWTRVGALKKSVLAKVRDCRERLLKYPLPVVTITSATLDEIGKVFIRVNVQGMRITSADRAIALMGELDVRAMAQELRLKVRNVFDLKTIDPILMGFNLISERQTLDSDPPKLEVMARRWSRLIESSGEELNRFRKTWHQYQLAFLKAVDYLHTRFPVHDESYLPSANMLATLAVFFFHHAGQPGALQKAEIRKWFWATGLAKRYSGAGYHRNIVADARLFEALANGRRRHFVLSLNDRLDPIHDIQGEGYQAGSARTRTFFCLLASLTPCDLDSGDPMDLTGKAISPTNWRHRHHVFPRAQLSTHVSRRAYNSLCNICFLISKNNLEIGSHVPRVYLTDFREIGGKLHFNRVMRSHLVPVGPDSGVWEKSLIKGFRRFRQERLKLICAAFERAAGMKLFRSS